MMIDLFLSKPMWVKDDNDSDEQRITLFDELEKIIWAIMTSEGRSEARFWLCDAISSLSSIRPNEQQELFLRLLRSKPLNRDLAAQVLQMIFERKPHKAGLILAKKSHRLEKFFEAAGDSAHGKGAKALSQFAFTNRDICWEELEWKGKHGQSPAIVATKPHYFLDLDVQRTVENFLNNVPEFWSSKDFAESLKDGEILAIDKMFFVNFFVNLMYEDNLKEVWEVVGQYLLEESFSYLCQHILIILDEQDLCALLQMLHEFLTRRQELVNFGNASYWLEILIRKCGDQVSMDQLFLLNALFNKGRQLLRLVCSDETEEEKAKINDLTLRIWTSTSSTNSLLPIARDHFRSNIVETMKWLGLLSWSLVNRLSEECHSSESWKALFVSNKIGFRKSDAYGLLEHDGTSEESELESADTAKHKKRRRSRKKRKKNLGHDIFHDDELLDLDGSNDRFNLWSSSTSWLLSTDGGSTGTYIEALLERMDEEDFQSIPPGFPQQGFVLNIVVYPAKLSTLQLFERNETVMKVQMHLRHLEGCNYCATMNNQDTDCRAPTKSGYPLALFLSTSSLSETADKCGVPEHLVSSTYSRAAPTGESHIASISGFHKQKERSRLGVFIGPGPDRTGPDRLDRRPKICQTLDRGPDRSGVGPGPDRTGHNPDRTGPDRLQTGQKGTDEKEEE
ncbi:LOW QUALITY PROTEIN: hypothetical protein Cgig2_012809 [Carnegiea gigantea]|uniref:Uncharacterized protein n=1 Tax=Carnegiea gigantea TaxID=171969 RepID=A0A9Q1KCK5_9CARY|nr:LOW QUALITY PROTEIN: hypothetical protein Cgig2_012809 [Carnegiea gigantea]